MIFYTCIILAFICAVTSILIRRLKLNLDKNRYAIFITGCDSGFGRDLALHLTTKGYRVVAGCYTTDGIYNIQSSLDSSGNLTAISLDVTSQESVDSAVKQLQKILDKEGRLLWALVNNAGILVGMGPDDWMTVQMYEKSLSVNTFGSIRMVHACKKLLKRSRGRIIGMTSILGRLAVDNMGPYVVSKFAAEAYYDVIRRELRDFGISVHILEPGGHRTGMTADGHGESAIEQTWAQTSDSIKAEYGQEYHIKGLVNYSTTVYFGSRRANLISVKGIVSSAITATLAQNTDAVIRAYKHALLARFPKDRYLVGTDAACVYGPISLAPTCVQDLAFSVPRYLGLYPKPRCLQTTT